MFQSAVTYTHRGAVGGQATLNAVPQSQTRPFDTRIEEWLKNALRCDSFAQPNAIVTEGGLGAARNAAEKLLQALRAASLHDTMTLGGYRTGAVRVVSVAELKSKDAAQLETYLSNAAGSIVLVADAEKLSASDAPTNTVRKALEEFVRPGSPVDGEAIVLLQATKEGTAQLMKEHTELARRFRVI